MVYHSDNGICFDSFASVGQAIGYRYRRANGAGDLFVFSLYLSVVTVSAIAVMTMVNYRMRSKALESPYCKALLGALIVPFFVSAVYNNYMGMLYSMLVLAAVICAFYLRSVMTGSLFNRMMDAACVASYILRRTCVFAKSRIVFYSTGLPADVGIFQCQLLCV
ncbi:hypothetical protein [Anaeromassilibacillus sp. SJQ-1]|uniref:hypothetical protein n=1 Tax=Anaeromassilibacillus sp. SJQ-1 TaxID=3375419 RepID=UPI003989365F